MNILGMYGGVTLGQHDPSAALICDGKLIAVCEEERFVRIKSPKATLPVNSIRACLREANLKMTDIDLVVNPGETLNDMPERIRRYLNHYFGYAPPVRMINHQLAHVASAFFCSGFERSMCMSYDAWGDQWSAALGVGTKDAGIEFLETREPQNSLGIYYATITSYLGFLVSEDEYKVMGLAAYGREGVDLSPFLRPTPDGYRVNMDYVRGDYTYTSFFEPLYSGKLVELLGPPRQPGEPITARHRDIAFAAQKMLEECAVSLITHLHNRTGLDSLCLAGGVGLNCSANRVLRETPFIRQLFVQPASSDRGLGLGCALQGAHENGVKVQQKLEHVSMGPTYSVDQLRQALELSGVAYAELSDPAREAAGMLAEGSIIGWFQGRSEFGPRALGNRSILADPRDARMKDEVNARIKFREEFRPFAPSVLEEHGSELFEMEEASPFMTVAYGVRPAWRERLGAVTHVNGTARVQTVGRAALPLYHQLISEFHRLTGVPVVLNTSFNVQGQPIVETPLDALSTFMGSGLDALFIGPFMIVKPHRPRR